MSRAHDASRLFAATFDADPEGVWAAPGRVNLIGEHVDYAGGVSLPFALEQSTYVAARLTDTGTYRLVSEYDGTTHEATVAVTDVGPGRPADWSGYVVGSLWAAAEAGLISSLPAGAGMDLAIVSDVPVGAGLSSSAALECAAAAAGVDLAGPGLDGPGVRERLIAPTIRAENEVVGAATGGLDQTVSLLARPATAIAIDFHSGQRRHVACDLAGAGLTLLIIDSLEKHALADGQYASRRGVIDAVTAFAPGSADTLRDVEDPEALARRWAAEEASGVPEEIALRRVRHVVEETRRAQDAADLLEAGDFAHFGELMTVSHRSLRDLYEVSTPKIDGIVEAALQAGALGARITGGGFGGCAIALVAEERAERVVAAVDDNVRCFQARPSAGARRES